METNIFKDRHSTNWEAELRPTEIATREELQVVLLAGLQRLAREAGLNWNECDIFTPSDGIVQAVYRARFIDGSQWVGAADCTKKNTKGKFSDYPTAIAESRAEARCLRKALGIRMLSSEEIGFKEDFGSIEASPGGRADGQLIIAIEKLCESRAIDPARVLEAVLEPERASSIFELNELTISEAQTAMAWLNEQKPKKVVATAKDQRDARKQELLAKQEKSNESNV